MEAVTVDEVKIVIDADPSAYGERIVAAFTSALTDGQSERSSHPVDLADWERRQKQIGMVDVTCHSGPADLRGDQEFTFSLATKCGAVLRYRVSRTDARALAQSLLDGLYGRDRIQLPDGVQCPAPSGRLPAGESEGASKDQL